MKTIKIYFSFKTSIVNLILFIVILLNNSLVYSQADGTAKGKLPNNNSAFDANGTIITNYMHSSCGLNYTAVSKPLHQRPLPFGIGFIQPTAFQITGIPNCAVIVKAFLYVSTSGDGVPINFTVTNPNNVISSYPMTLIGQDIDKCWSRPRSCSYRADVTSMVSGNGNYIISGIPVVPQLTNNDADGATLFVIYDDPSANYFGNIVIADGACVGIGQPKNATITGFTAFDTAFYTRNFFIIADLQQLNDATFKLNDASYNYTLGTLSQQFYDYIDQPGTPIAIGQTSASYGINVVTDCYNWLMAGFYYRSHGYVCPNNTYPNIQISANQTIICSGGTVTLSATGANSFSWSTSSNSSSIIVSPTVTTTYSVSDSLGCKSAMITVSITTCEGIKLYTSIENPIKIYPNPSNNNFSIETTSTEKLGVELSDPSGKLLINQNFSGKANIDTENVPNGIYFIKVIGEQRQTITAKKFIVQH